MKKLVTFVWFDSAKGFIFTGDLELRSPDQVANFFMSELTLEHASVVGKELLQVLGKLLFSAPAQPHVKPRPLPFRIVGIAVGGALELVWALITLPARVLRGFA